MAFKLATHTSSSRVACPLVCPSVRPSVHLVCLGGYTRELFADMVCDRRPLTTDDGLRAPVWTWAQPCEARGALLLQRHQHYTCEYTSARNQRRPAAVTVASSHPLAPPLRTPLPAAAAAAAAPLPPPPP
eukprot:SAG25_NODE_4507_length_801_cov_0.960114_1_plen_129_part_01